MADIPIHAFPPRYGARPRLVPVEVQEVQSDGERLFSVRPRGRRDDSSVVLSADALAVAELFDGTRDLRGVQRAVKTRYGQLLYVERIHDLARVLERAGLLGRERRQARFAGEAYSDDPDTLRHELDSYFTAADGPGAQERGAPDSRVLGVLAPHVDLHHGGPMYAHAYRALADGSDADLFVLLGTTHAGTRSLFTLTRRDYDTPLGPVPTDERLVNALVTELGDKLVHEESAHDEEHSLEFQAVLLRHVLGDGRRYTVLPVLCSSLYELDDPSRCEEVDRFVDALRRLTRGRKVCYVAAADLSHVGPLYGDDAPPTTDALERLAAADRESLDLFVRGDAAGFFRQVSADADTRRVCGLAPMYAFLRLTGGRASRLLGYSQWRAADDDSTVTYAAAVLDGTD